MEFKSLGLHEDLLKALDEAGFTDCMPVQEAVFAHSLAGEDIYAQSQTGTGKTAAFLVTILQRVMMVPELRKRKSLILAPTRELAVQIETETKRLSKYLPVSSGSFYGGVSYGPQIDMLRDDVQIIIGTPGRIIDLIQQGKMLLKDVGFLVIDEADRMFDMGFIDDLRKLIRYLPPPAQRQTFLFSATLNVRVKNLAWEYMDSPKEIVIEPEKVTVEQVTQELYHVGSDEKFRLLLGLLAREKPQSALIFCNQKFMAEEVARRLRANGVECEFIMGDLPQAKRLQVIDRLKTGRLEILVATDVAARGLDVEALDLVVNYDVPLDAESYVHRIGRTARAGKAGKAVTLACEKFVYGLPAIEKYIGMRIPSLPFDESLLAEDKSAGMRFGHRHEEGRRERGSASRDRGRGGLDRSGRARRPQRPAGRRGPGRPAERQGMSSIQRSIAEAAGRSLQNGPEEIRSTERDRRGPEAGRQGAKRGERQRPAEARRDGSGGAQAISRNPYDMPMEERMKMYKQRYGEGGSGGAARQENRRDSQPRGGKDQAGRPREGQGRAQRPQEQRQQSEGQRGGRHQGQGPQNERPQGQRRQGQAQGGRPASGGQSQQPQTAPQAAAAPRKNGFLDKLKSLFGRKK